MRKATDILTKLNNSGCLDYSNKILKESDIDQIVSQLVFNLQITKLKLKNTNLTQLSVKLIESIINTQKLASIDLSDTPIKFSEATLKKLQANINITSIKIARSCLENNEQQLHHWLARNRALKKVIQQRSTELNFSQICLNSFDINIIFQKMSEQCITFLTSINFRSCGITFTENHIDQLCSIIRSNPQLQVIDLDENILAHNFIAKIRQLINNNKHLILNYSDHGHKQYISAKDLVTTQNQNGIFNDEIKYKVSQWRAYSHAHFELIPNLTNSATIINLDNKDFSHIDFSAKTITENRESENGSYQVTLTYYLKIEKRYSLKNCNFFKTILNKSNLTNIPFNHTNLGFALLNEVNWYKVNLNSANICYAILTRGRLINCNLDQANAEGANFNLTNLTGSSFVNANCKTASFCQAILRNANFTNANLQQADFTNANLKGANFSGADLRYTTGLSAENLKDAIIIGAKLPYKLNNLGSAIPSLPPNHINKELHAILESLQNSHSKINILTLEQLKILYHEGLKYSETMKFTKHNQYLIKNVCRKKVMARYLMRFFPITTDLANTIMNKKNYQLPNKPFLIKSNSNPIFNIFKQINRDQLFLVMIKPEGIPHMLAIFNMLELEHVKIVAIKSTIPTKKEIAELYKNDKQQYFFNAIVNYLSSGTNILMAVQGQADKLLQCKKDLRKLLHSSLNFEAQKLNPFKDSDNQNFTEWANEYIATFDVLHCSDLGNNNREINLFFKESETEYPLLNSETKYRIIDGLLKIKNTKQSLLVKQNNGAVNQTCRVLMIIKPEGKKYSASILSSFLKADIKIIACKSKVVSESTIKKLYKKYKDFYFHQALIDYVANKNLTLFVLEGKFNSIQESREQVRRSLEPYFIDNAKLVLGKMSSSITKMTPQQEKIFIDEYCLTFDIIHCSDFDDGKNEIPLFFDKDEIGVKPVSVDNKRDIMNGLISAKHKTQFYVKP